MSSTSPPIPLPRFRAALPALPLSSLYAKHAELANNMAHMRASNAQLEEYARAHDDRECFEALLENREVMKRFEERMRALEEEVVQGRGLVWRPGEEEGGKMEGEEVAVGMNGGETNGAAVNGTTTTGPSASGAAAAAAREGASDGRAQNGENEEGVFL